MAIDADVEWHYAFSARHPERADVYRTLAEASAAARDAWPSILDQPYGAHPRERIDLFPGRAGAPLLIFVHGGYWRSHDKSSFSGVAPAFLAHGISVAVVGYPLAPESGLPRIVDSVRAAVAWLQGEGRAHLPAFGPIVVCGHSAGAHLAAMAAIEAPSVNGCVALSGIFDLAPLLRTSIGADVRLDAATARTASPLAQPPGVGWLLAAVGGAETPAFLEQTRRYADHWGGAGRTANTLTLPGANHYTVLLEFLRGDGMLLRHMRRLMTSAERAS